MKRIDLEYDLVVIGGGTGGPMAAVFLWAAFDRGCLDRGGDGPYRCETLRAPTGVWTTGFQAMGRFRRFRWDRSAAGSRLVGRARLWRNTWARQ